MLSLQWKELEYLHTNFQNLATSSAVLVGFGFTALGFDTKYHPEHGTNHSSIWELKAKDWGSGVFLSEVLFQTLFSVSASFALSFNLLSLFIATIASMCGPGMALRGPEGSVGLAVRHMEQQLKRSLRFFGRGVVAILFTLTTVGLRNLQDVGFAGGVITVFIGLWTFHALWSYGSEIAEKFYVSPDRAVRGTFVYGANGSQPIWTNTLAEKEESLRRATRSWPCLKQRWRPDGHSATTPLWRLDKMIAFPYHDETKVQASGEGGLTDHKAAAGERAQMQQLVLSAQGPIASLRLRRASSGFDPMAIATMIHEAVLGTDDDEGAPSREGMRRGGGPDRSSRGPGSRLLPGGRHAVSDAPSTELSSARR